MLLSRGWTHANEDAGGLLLSHKGEPKGGAVEGLRIAVMEGDGIGPDIVRATEAVLRAAVRDPGVRLVFEHLPVGLSALESHGSTLPQVTLGALDRCHGWILGPVTHHIYDFSDPRYINPSGFLRKRFDLFANIRPCHSYPGVKCLYPDVDLVIVRENTEGFYADRNVLDGNGEFRPSVDEVISVRVVTRRASLRVAREAFQLARSRGKQQLVTAVHKANVLRRGCGLFLEACRAVAADFPDVEFNDLHADAFAMRLVQRPQDFDVVVTTNLFGDIFSDEASALVGGLGLAPGLNVGEHMAMAQATHGSAPDIADRHIGNPCAEILSGKLLLQWLATRYKQHGLQDAAERVEAAVEDVLLRRDHVTADLGGTAHTMDMAGDIVSALERI
jgi:3-isopropylmalate dehydrogenase